MDYEIHKTQAHKTIMNSQKFLRESHIIKYKKIMEEKAMKIQTWLLIPLYAFRSFLEKFFKFMSNY